MPGGPHAEKLRQAIDTGRTGGKVSHPDPAAAPLGTDEEAAGTPLQGRLVDQALRDEIRKPPQPAAEAPARRPRTVLLVIVAAVALAAALVWLSFG